jgi:hypothetical protein
MRKFKLMFLFLVLSFAAMAQTARLQAIHNSPSPTVDIWVNGVPFLTDFAFREATPFIDVPAGVLLEIGIAPSPSTSPADIIATFPVTLADGSTYVLMAHGVVGDMMTPFNLAVYDMGQETGTAGSVDLLAFHGAPDAPAVDITARGVAKVVDNISFSDFQGYFSVPANRYILDVAPAGTNTIVASFEADLSGLGGGAGVVFASGFLGADPGFGLFAALPDGTVIPLPALTDARVQIIHNSPSPTVDIWVNDQPFLTDVDFRTATAFVDVPGNTDLNIGIAPSPSASPADIIATFPVNFLAGETYTVIANGVVGDINTPFNLEVFAGTREAAVNPEGTDLLIFHGSPDAPAVDIAIRGLGDVVTDLSFAEYAGYLEVPVATDVIIDIKPTGSQTIVATYAAPLSLLAGQSATVVASGFLGADPSFGLFAVLADGTVIPLPALTDARVQIIHNSPSPTVDIWVNDQPFLTNFDFRTATPFVNVPGNTDLNIGIAPSPSASPADIIATFPVNFLAGETYTVIANGVVGDVNTPFNLEVFAGSREEAVAAEGIDLLVFHGSPDAPAVDVAIRGLGNVVTDLSFAEYNGYLEVPVATDVILDIKPAGSPAIVASFAAPLSLLTGQSATVVATGFLGADPSFGLMAVLADGTVISLEALTDARVQIIHNSPSPTVDIWVNDQPFLTNFDFRTATPFVNVPGNTDLNIGIAPSPSSSPADIIATFPANFPAGSTYTVIANGVVGDMDTPFNLEVLANTRESASANDKVDVLVFHGSPDAPAVDVLVNGGLPPAIVNLAFGESTGYIGLDPASYTLGITPTGDNGTVVASYTADITALAGGAATIFASGFLGDTPGFGLWVALADGTTFPLPVITSTENPTFGTLSVFPNPITDQVNIRLNSLVDTRVDMTLIDLQGRAQGTLSTQVTMGENQLVFPAANINQGMYILEVHPASGEPLQLQVVKF